jgi:hypothetical protein
MNYQPRRERVQKLISQALQDRQPHKYIQGRFILSEIEKREQAQTNYRNLFLTNLKPTA